MADAEPETLSRLRHRAERALEEPGASRDAVQLLDKLALRATPGSEHWLFAHRQLAELKLEAHPWQAALHLRKVVDRLRDDDGVHALMGLCQAVLGNYRAAVSCYRRALALSPRNPWYHHNLGHLMDVGVGDSERAVEHLRAAHRIHPEEHEIAGSLARCLAALQHYDEAEDAVGEALRHAPENADHLALREWIRSQRDQDTQASSSAEHRPCYRPSRSPQGAIQQRDCRAVGSAMDPPAEAVLQVLRAGMDEAGFSDDQMARARAMWFDFREANRGLRVVKPEVFAAAVEYALCKVQCLEGITKASVARRYGVATASISSRYLEIRRALSLEPGDPRYAMM